MAPIIIIAGIILVAFSNFYRGTPNRCCRVVPDLSWTNSRQQESKKAKDGTFPSRINSA